MQLLLLTAHHLQTCPSSGMRRVLQCAQGLLPATTLVASCVCTCPRGGPPLAPHRCIFQAEIKIEAEAKLNASGEVVVKVDKETNDVDKEKVSNQLSEGIQRPVRAESAGGRLCQSCRPQTRELTSVRCKFQRQAVQ